MRGYSEGVSQPPPDVSVRPRRARVALAAVGFVVLIGVVTASGMLWEQASHGAGSASASGGPTQATSTPTPRPTPAQATAPTPVPPSFDKNARSIDDPASIWVVSNKTRPLNPVDFEPGDLVDVPVAHTWDPVLRQDASDALVAMFGAAQSEAGLALASNSAYRSYSTQVRVYDSEVAAFGQAAAEQSVARPGHSEHQTGLAVDISPLGASNCSAYTCIGSTPQGRWLAANAWRFGFVLRYESGRTSVTGYNPEPWHFRFVGTAASRDYRQSAFHTLEQYFGLPAAPRY